MKKTLIVFFAALFAALPLFAKISFGTPSINNKDEVLFTIKQDMSGANPYKSLFYVKLKEGEPEKNPEAITCYPEQMELLDNGTILQIRNRFGVARYSAITDSLEWISRVKNLPLNALPPSPYSVSPDGKFICKIQRTGLCSGNLIVENVNTKKTAVICDGILNSYEEVPVKWSSDSSTLLYENNGTVYFCNPDACVRGVEIDEKYRKTGLGTINSVCWTSSKYLAYIDDCILYKINSRELYTLGLYSGIIGQGTAMGRVPFRFNPQTDKFYTNDEVESIVVIQNDKIFSYLKKQFDGIDYLDVIYSRPYSDSTASLVDTYVFWNQRGEPILWQEKLPYSGEGEKAAVYKLDVKATRVLEIQDSGKPFISPDGSKVAFFANDWIYVYDINSWKKLAELTGEKVVSSIWANRNVLYVGGENTIRKWSLISGTAETITLSSVEKPYWDDDDKTVVAKIQNNIFYKYNCEKGTWKSQAVEPITESKTQNGRYRVFTGTTANKQFCNALYVRMLSKKAVTKPVFAQSVGKNVGNKKVALVFDAYQNADGLPRILSVLEKYNLPATFYINGEFIRRYPMETKQIVAKGYNCGSMFFSTTDLTGDSFIIDEDFIRRGLARNEDEFFQVTGKELTLYWHAPYYSVTPELISYGERAGYTYTNSYQLVNDGDKDALVLQPDLIIQNYCAVLKKTGGGIVPVSVGYYQSEKKNPLYENLDLLICALMDSGFDFVKVEDL